MKIGAGMAEKLSVKDWGFHIHLCPFIYNTVFQILSLHMDLFLFYKMADDKNKTSLIRHRNETEKNITLKKINNTTLVLCICFILSSLGIYFFCKCYWGSFPVISSSNISYFSPIF